MAVQSRMLVALVGVFWSLGSGVSAQKVEVLPPLSCAVAVKEMQFTMLHYSDVRAWMAESWNLSDEEVVMVYRRIEDTAHTALMMQRIREGAYKDAKNDADYINFSRDEIDNEFDDKIEESLIKQTQFAGLKDKSLEERERFLRQYYAENNQQIRLCAASLAEVSTLVKSNQQLSDYFARGAQIWLDYYKENTKQDSIVRVYVK